MRASRTFRAYTCPECGAYHSNPNAYRKNGKIVVSCDACDNIEEIRSYTGGDQA